MKESAVRQSVLDYAWRRLASAYAVVPKRRARWLVAEAGFKAFNLEDTAAGAGERAWGEAGDGMAGGGPEGGRPESGANWPG